MKVIISLLLLSTVSFAANGDDKPAWKSGCVSMFYKQMQEMAARGQLALEPKEQKEMSEGRCEKVKTTIDWNKTKNNRFIGCADAVQYLLDGAGVTDRQRRKQMLVDYCM